MEIVVSVLIAVLVLLYVLRRANSWIYEGKLGEKKYSLPPGDMGWPIIGNMWAFLRAFKSKDPDSFIASFQKRFGKTHIYKVFMFGKPSIIITSPDTIKRVLSDDDNFKSGWPLATVELIGRKSFVALSFEEHKRLRKLTAAPVNGHEALSLYIPYIEDCVKSALDVWVKEDTIEFLTELRRLTFRIIMYIFLSSEGEHVMEKLEANYTALNHGVRAMAINFPGFAFYRALKARKEILAVFQGVVDQRRRRVGEKKSRKDMMDALLEVEDQDGRKLTDEEIIDVMLMYLNAGHESSGHTMMWAAVLLQEHPEFFKKAKEEQEMIVKRRPASQKGLTLSEIRQMEYLSKVIDETLRWVSFSFVVFREAKADVNVNGYMVPKGWKVLAWFRSVHMDSEVYPDPKEFNPSRWDDFVPKVGGFVPFGLGSRLCPGNDLAKLEIGIFLHYFLLGFKLERMNPDSWVQFLPHRRPVDNCVAKIRRVSAN